MDYRTEEKKLKKSRHARQFQRSQKSSGIQNAGCGFCQSEKDRVSDCKCHRVGFYQEFAERSSQQICGKHHKNICIMDYISPFGDTL